MATGGDVQAVTCEEDSGKSVGVAEWWSMTRQVWSLVARGGLCRLPWSRTKMYEGWCASISVRSEGLWTVSPFFGRCTSMSSSRRPRRMRVCLRMAPEERPSASLSGTINVFLFALALS